MKKISYLILLSIPFLIQCKTPKLEKMNNESYQVIDMDRFDYLDGNGNKYSITPESIIYDPITAAESSTGMYDGGEPYTISISVIEFEILQETAMNCINKKEGIIENRIKGSGMLIIEPGNKIFIFDMNSTQRAELENTIQSITKK